MRERPSAAPTLRPRADLSLRVAVEWSESVQKSVARIKQKVGDLLVPRNVGRWPEVRSRLSGGPRHPGGATPAKVPTSLTAPLAIVPGLPQLPRPPSSHAVLTTPVDSNRCLLVSSLSARPSPLCRRVGIHDFTFEARSSFTRVTACQIAPPPYVGFISRLRPNQFPGSDARELSNPTNNYLSGSF
jgi:hypothetical protein